MTDLTPSASIDPAKKEKMVRAFHEWIAGKYDMEDSDVWCAAWRAALSGTPKEEPEPVALIIVLDGPPSHDGGRFVEIEDANGKSFNAGEWKQRTDGLWELRVGARHLAAHPVRESPATEFCWLVELFEPNGGNSMGFYHTGFTTLGGDSRSTKDPHQAKRYPSKAQAAAVAADLFSKAGVWRAVEHGFSRASLVEQPSDDPLNWAKRAYDKVMTHAGTLIDTHPDLHGVRLTYFETRDLANWLAAHPVGESPAVAAPQTDALTTIYRQVDEGMHALIIASSGESADSVWKTRYTNAAKGLAALASQGASTPTLPAWWDDFIQNVCEIPDRNSPEDEPEAMVATAKELEFCALRAIESQVAPAEQPTDTQDSGEKT